MMAVDVLWSLVVLMVLSAVNKVESHKSSRGMITAAVLYHSVCRGVDQLNICFASDSTSGLFCTNDFLNNVTCTWNQSSVGPRTDCWVSGVKNVWNFKTQKLQHMM